MKRALMAFMGWMFYILAVHSQHLAAFHDNMDNFYVFDKGKIQQLEYLKVQDFSIGGTCMLYKDSRNHLKMYYNGEVTELSVNNISEYKAMDYLAVYSYAGIIHIIENGKVRTINTHSSIITRRTAWLPSMMMFRAFWQLIIAGKYTGLKTDW